MKLKEKAKAGELKVVKPTNGSGADQAGQAAAKKKRRWDQTQDNGANENSNQSATIIQTKRLAESEEVRFSNLFYHSLLPK